MQEKARMQRQLGRMREEGLRDYLEQKLQAIASEEVVNDIIRGFIEEHNCQFLESVTESIMESKQTIKHLRESIDLMKREEQALLEREKEKAREQCKQEHYLQMSALKEELRSIKVNLQKEEQHYVVKVEDVRRQLQSSLRINQELTEKLDKNKAIMDQMNATITKLTIQINEKHIKISQFEEKVFQNRTEIIEKQRQYEQEVNKIKKQHLNRERQLRQQLQKQAQRNMNHLTQQYELKLNNLQQKVRYMEIQSKNHLEKWTQITQQLQRKDLENRQVVLRNELIAQSLKKTQIFLQKKQEQCETLQNEFESQKQQNKELQIKINQIQTKNMENNSKHMHLVTQLRDSINQLQKQKDILLLEKGYAEQKMAKQRNEHALTIANYEQQMQKINKNMVQLEKIVKISEQKLAKEVQLNFMNQEEIKNLLKCNFIQQQEISKLEMRIRTIQEQSKAQIITYQETFAINVQDLQSEVAALKKQNEKLRAEMREMEHDLELQSQTEKYYHKYIQEIAHLKRELAQYQSRPRQLSSSNKDKLIQHLPKMIRQLSRQNHKLRQDTQNEMSMYQQQFKKLFRLLFTIMQQNELKNVHSYHLMQKTRSPQRQQMLMDKTLPRQHPEKPSGINSFKRNLKQIQQRYQKAHCQNQSFTMRVDSFLNNS